MCKEDEEDADDVADADDAGIVYLFISGCHLLLLHFSNPERL